MVILTKYDVLVYLSNGSVEKDRLVRRIRQNVFFEKTAERKIRQLVAELKREGLILKNKEILALTGKATDMLAFLLWAKKDGIDYNIPLRKANEGVFRKIFESQETALIAKSGFSKPTALKIARELESINFIKAAKKKPLIVRANVTDRTIFFANALGYDFAAFQKRIKPVGIKKDSPKLREHLIKLHVYSTTVTEGNTATQRDVERILNNLDSRLTPKEVMEIINAKKAVDEVCRICKTEELSVPLIKRLHSILMANLIEEPGEFSYARKRIIGSPAKLPDSKLEIDTAVQAALTFYAKYKERMNPLVLSAIVHFLLVSIHPFIDGNGRVARLAHSFILMKKGLPLFAFDPDHKNKYFELLDKGRSESIEDFIAFCIEKHKELIERP